jgi:hypothetical protein
MNDQAQIQAHEDKLAEDIAAFRFDPYGYVMYVFPWGEKGTFLEDFPNGPDKWQTKTLKRIGELMKESELVTHEPVRILRRSGHEIGKTALIAWVIHWFNATRNNPQGVVTANTKLQLESKTWREVAKWNGLAINGHWFAWTATKFYFKAEPATWVTHAIPWVKEKSEAFAGTHEKRGVLLVFDEASLIDDKIWEVADGAMDEGALWLAFGNPTQNTGRFYQNAVGRFRHRWDSERVDSRDSGISNKKRIEQWIQDYGEDSDYVRVRVLGEFPRASAMQFIPSDVVMAAAGRSLNVTEYNFAPKVLGVDVARFGDDQSAMIWRQGLASWGLRKFRNIDIPVLAGVVGQEIQMGKPDAIFIDATGGYGLSLIFELKRLGYQPIEVQFGASATDTVKWANKRAEIWGRMKEWLISGGAIPDDDELKTDLVGPEYTFVTKQGCDVVILEKKEDMKSRGLASPDAGDALAVTFALPVVLPSDQPNNTAVAMPSVGYNPADKINHVQRQLWKQLRGR